MFRNDVLDDATKTRKRDVLTPTKRVFDCKTSNWQVFN